MSSLVLLAVISGVLEQGTQERQAGFFDPDYSTGLTRAWS